MHSYACTVGQTDGAKSGFLIQCNSRKIRKATDAMRQQMQQTLPTQRPYLSLSWPVASSAFAAYFLAFVAFAASDVNHAKVYTQLWEEKSICGMICVCARAIPSDSTRETDGRTHLWTNAPTHHHTQTVSPHYLVKCITNAPRRHASPATTRRRSGVRLTVTPRDQRTDVTVCWQLDLPVNFTQSTYSEYAAMSIPRNLRSCSF